MPAACPSSPSARCSRSAPSPAEPMCTRSPARHPCLQIGSKKSWCGLRRSSFLAWSSNRVPATPFRGRPGPGSFSRRRRRCSRAQSRQERLRPLRTSVLPAASSRRSLRRSPRSAHTRCTCDQSYPPTTGLNVHPCSVGMAARSTGKCSAVLFSPAVGVRTIWPGLRLPGPVTHTYWRKGSTWDPSMRT